MNLFLCIIQDNAIPPWRQLHDHIRRLITDGTLAPGMALPPVRQLASDLSLAPGTVARAYKELESVGVLITAGRHGTVVADQPPRYAPEKLPQLAESFVQQARELGADRIAVFNAINAAWPITKA